MESAEASGKTVEDALNRALSQLGARREDVEFTVLDEGKRGLFGRGGRDAVVRVERLAAGTAPEPAPTAAPDTRIPRGQGGGRDPQRQGAAAGQQRGQRQRGRERAPGGGGGGGRGRGERRSSLENPAPRLTEDDFLRPRFDEPPGEGAAAPEPRQRAERGERREGRDRSHDRPEERERREERRRQREEQPPVQADINAEDVDFAAHIVDDILQLLDIEADITIREPVTAGDGKDVVRAVIDITGDDLGLLIGRRGDTLLALQYLVNLIVTRRFPGPGGVTIDVEHYRHRREDQVVSLARRMADRVRQTGNAITLEPMSAAERRLVHMAIADDSELETNSIGEGENRKVVISARR